MARKLTLVVTCTERKSVPIPPDLMLRSLPLGSSSDRLRLWTERTQQAPPRARLRDLYQGDAWHQALRLELAVRTAGYEPELWVASAGLGLRRADDVAPPYAATFAMGQPDSVASSIEDARSWWTGLTARQCPEAAVAVERPALWVLSNSYSKVITPHLLSLRRGDELLVVGGSSDVPDYLRLPSDRALRQALGGTATSLNVRTAIAWVERLEGEPITSVRARARWANWASSVRHSEIHNRKPLTDSAVLDFIRELTTSEPELSKTRALRSLRGAGLACEQRRFGELFMQARGPK